MRMTDRFLLSPAAVRLLRSHAIVFLIFMLLSIFWSVQFQDKGPEAIRTSDTTDVFYGIVIGARVEHAQYQEGSSSLLEQIVKDQLVTWQSCGMADCYQAQFNTYLKSVYLVTGDITEAYKILVAPLNLIYLVGCYLLFLSITGNRGISLLFSLLASFPIAIPLAGENFGMGPFTNFSRRHLFTAFVPIALYGFYRYRDNIRLLLPVFVFFGLIANLHASGILLIEIAILAYFILHPLSLAHFINTLALLGVSFAAGFIALGRLWAEISGFLGKLVAFIIPAVHATGFDLMAGIPPAVQYLFYPPHIYSHLPEPVVHLMSISVFCLALAPLLLRRRVTKSTYGNLLFLSSLSVLAFLGFSELKFWLFAALLVWFLSNSREPTRDTELTSLLILSIYFVSFVLMVAFQFAHLFVADFPAIFNNLRGARFVGILVFIWLLSLLNQLDYSGHGQTARHGLVFVMAVAVLVDVRHLVRSNFRRLPDQEETRSLLQVAKWAREHTPLAAGFYVASSAFGIVSERVVYMTNKRSRQCPECALATRNADPNALLAAGKEEGMNYVVLKNMGQLHPPSVYSNTHFSLLPID